MSEKSEGREASPRRTKARPTKLARLPGGLSLEQRRERPYVENRRGGEEAAAALQTDREEVRQGGGAKAAARQHAKGRLTARERVALLLDEGAELDELMTFAGYRMYQEEGGAPSGGVVTGIGKVAG